MSFHSKQVQNTTDLNQIFDSIVVEMSTEHTVTAGIKMESRDIQYKKKNLIFIWGK